MREANHACAYTYTASYLRKPLYVYVCMYVCMSRSGMPRFRNAELGVATFG